MRSSLLSLTRSYSYFAWITGINIKILLCVALMPIT